MSAVCAGTNGFAIQNATTCSVGADNLFDFNNRMEPRPCNGIVFATVTVTNNLDDQLTLNVSNNGTSASNCTNGT